jgi:hypothetical protein
MSGTFRPVAEGVMAQDAHAAHIRRRFKDARVATEPYPHLVIDNILPADLYSAIERDAPTSARWHYSALLQTLGSELTAKRRQHPSRRWTLLPIVAWRTALACLSGRGLVQPAIDCVNPNRTSSGLSRQARDWQRRYSAPISLVNTLVETAFASHTANYMAELVAAGVFSEPQQQRGLVHEFCQRMPGWTISPHAHDIGQSIQWMIYFPLPGSTEDQGTMFYRLKSSTQLAGAKTVVGSIFFDPAEVEYCFTAPYRRNTLIAFLNAPYCVHATREDSGAVPRRYFFGCNWWSGAARPVDLTVSPRSISAVRQQRQSAAR